MTRAREIKEDDLPDARFLGKPVPDEEARKRWPHRYQETNQERKEVEAKGEDGKKVMQARKHYTQAEVDGNVVYNLYDDAHVEAGKGNDCFICKIIEMFEGIDGMPYFRAQWFYRARDTVIKDVSYLIDEKRVFYSEIKDDNDLDCLVKRLTIARVPLDLDLESKKQNIPDCDYFCDMLYLVPYSSFVNLPENCESGNETSSTISSDACTKTGEERKSNNKEVSKKAGKLRLLDLYSGCGGMSTGLCLGAEMAGLNLETWWAVDLNPYACESLKWNHGHTQVRNETAEDFLSLMKEWIKLCCYFSLVKSESGDDQDFNPFALQADEVDEDDDDDDGDEDNNDPEVFEVEEVLDICFGDPKEAGERKLHLKVRWKNYGPDDDTWEPLEGLSNCREIIKRFVTNGYNSKIIPIPGDVDVVCGGPPCQGISGFNRFRDSENPLNDEKNKQLLVYMDIVEYLKPKFVLMENVVDILKFADGFLGRFALARLIQMNYQTRMGMMAAGAYGLAQFRMRVFVWGARPNEKLPQYPLPTHDVVVRGFVPLEFDNNAVAFDEGQQPKLEEKLLLKDAISDLPAVDNYEERDEMSYGKEPETEFQRFIRSTKEDMLGLSEARSAISTLFDHRPLELNTDDIQRVCQIPKKKGANFQNLKGVRTGPKGKAELDPDVERVYLASGKPLVPDYAISYRSQSKPFARLWWDETVPTVVTRAEPHNQKIIHPEQDRVLTIRENARLQGFPDYYKLFGPIKERYIQVGNAVAVPVARALGYSLAMAFQGLANNGNDPLMTLPAGFPNPPNRIASESSEQD